MQIAKKKLFKKPQFGYFEFEILTSANLINAGQSLLSHFFLTAITSETILGGSVPHMYGEYEKPYEKNSWH